MAAPTNTFTTTTAVGNREDLSDIIYNVSPMDTPFFSMIGTSQATGTKHEWQTDAYAAPAVNAQPEGNDASNIALDPTVRLSNYTQIFTKAGLVSGTQDVVKKAGRKSELTYQVTKKIVEVKKDIELALVGNQTPAATDPRSLRPLAGWLATNVDAGTGWAAGSASAAMTPGTARTFTEAMLQGVIEKCYESGGNPTKLMVAPSKKVVITNTFTGSGSPVRTQRVASDRSAGSRVDVYYSDFGTFDVVPNRVMKSADSALNNEDKVYVIEPKFWSAAVLRPLKRVELAKTGDSDRFMLVTELTLEARNEASSGAVFDLT